MQTSELRPYIAKQLHAGHSLQAIRQALLQQGWSNESVTNALGDYAGNADFPAAAISTRKASVLPLPGIVLVWILIVGGAYYGLFSPLWFLGLSSLGFTMIIVAIGLRSMRRWALAGYIALLLAAIYFHQFDSFYILKPKTDLFVLGASLLYFLSIWKGFRDSGADNPRRENYFALAAVLAVIVISACSLEYQNRVEKNAEQVAAHPLPSPSPFADYNVLAKPQNSAFAFSVNSMRLTLHVPANFQVLHINLTGEPGSENVTNCIVIASVGDISNCANARGFVVNKAHLLIEVKTLPVGQTISWISTKDPHAQAIAIGSLPGYLVPYPTASPMQEVNAVVSTTLGNYYFDMYANVPSGSSDWQVDQTAFRDFLSTVKFDAQVRPGGSLQ